MTRSCEEVWASESVLLCFDGHVLEVFGLVDVHRFHIAMGLELQVSDRRSSKVRITAARGPSMTVYCDSDRLDDLRTFAGHVTAATP